MNVLQLSFTGLLALAVTACASGPRFDTSQTDASLTASKVAGAPAAGTRVVWGGVIVATRNLSDYTEVEILSYPLADDQSPDTRAAEQGRFIARHNGYLEVVDYAPGRQVTISGAVLDAVAGKVGEAAYTFPRVQTDAIYLWPRGTEDRGPRVHFGIGVTFSR